MTEEEKIFKGELFCPGDPSLKAIKLRTHNLNLDYNALYEDETEKRDQLLHQIVGSLGKNVFIQGPVFFHYGRHTKIGDNTFINFNLTVQDDAKVTIGHDCNFGPNVTIVTPQHPLLPDERRAIKDKDGKMKHMCYAEPVTIGNDCWLGANVVVCPGVTIGDNCVIGAGSVVTKDIPANTLAYGDPCRPVRTITERDSVTRCSEAVRNVPSGMLY